MTEPGAGKGFFGDAPTLWSTILRAKEGTEDSRLSALGRLLERYQRPIQSEIRWQCGCPEDQARELGAEFIATFLRRDFLKNVSPDQGRFRTFVKRCIRNFLRDVHVAESAQKRGDSAAPLSLDATDEEGSRLIDPPDSPPSLESGMDREWALAVLHAAMDRLEQDCVAAGRRALFEALRPTLSGSEEATPLAAVGTRLGMSEGAVKVAAHRLRQRLGELIEEEVRQTIGEQDDWREELCYLVELLGRR